MFLMSAYIVIEGGKGATSSFCIIPASLGNTSVIVTGGAGFVTLVTFLINQKVESNSINILMKDTLSDTLMNFGTTLGISLSIEINPMFDGVTVVVLGPVLCCMPYLIVKENVFHLSGDFEPEMVENYRNVIEGIPEVERIIDIIGKIFGEEGTVIVETIEQKLASCFDIDVQVRPKR